MGADTGTLPGSHPLGASMAGAGGTDQVVPARYQRLRESPHAPQYRRRVVRRWSRDPASAGDSIRVGGLETALGSGPFSRSVTPERGACSIWHSRARFGLHVAVSPPI